MKTRSNIPLETIDRLAYEGTSMLPVVLSRNGYNEGEVPIRAHIHFDSRESQRFPGRIWVKLVEEK